MNRMIRAVCYAQKSVMFFSGLCLFVPPAPAMDWPSVNLVRNFGWNDSGIPSRGSVFEGEEPVLAAENGELVFFRRAGDTVSRLPSPFGTWAAVDHGDSLIGIYGRLDSAADSPPLRIRRNTPIARPGISGWARNRGFCFVLYDRRERRWVNPSMIITPLPDTRPPQILSVELRNARGVPVTGTRNIAQGRYTIVVSARDTRLEPGEVQLAPHSIICSINGIEAGALNFETITARDGILLVNRGGTVSARQVCAPFPAYEAGEAFLSRGQAALEVIAQDIAGNSRRVSMRIQVE